MRGGTRATKLNGTRRTGSGTAFVDSTSDEVLLHFSTEDDGSIRISYHLYDAKGELVAEKEGLKAHSTELIVQCSKGEQLLSVPKDPNEHIRYRLYNKSGLLITSSDGQRTRIFGMLRMDTR